MNLPLDRVFATATRLAVLTSTNGATHAVADALAPFIERLFRMSPHKILLSAAILVVLMFATRPVLSQAPGADRDAALDAHLGLGIAIAELGHALGTDSTP